MSNPNMNRRSTIQGWKNQPLSDSSSSVVIGSPTGLTAEEAALAAPVCQGPITLGSVYPSTTATTVREVGENVFCARFSPDGNYIAACYGNGAVRIFADAPRLPLTTTTRFKTHQTYKVTSPSSEPPDPQPITCIQWRPHCPNNYELLTTESEGFVHQWTWNPSSNVEHLAKQSEADNEILTCEYSPDGNTFITAGSDRIIRAYDTMSGRLQQQLTVGVTDQGRPRATHTNRIFSTRYVNPNVLISAGWENAIQIWDLRIGKSIRQFAGTRVCSDAIDVNLNTTQVIVASHRHEKQIVLFDYLSGREIPNDEVNRNLGEVHMYAARLGADQRTLWCLGSKPNSLFVLDIVTGEVRAKVTNLFHSLFSLQMDPKMPNTRAVLGGFNDSVMVAELV